MLNLKDPTLLKTQNFIGGEWVAGGAGTIDVTNPANGAIVATTANGDAADATRAVEAAAEAFKVWSRMPAKQRAVLLRNWFNLLMANADDLGAIMTAEQGKPLAESIGEVGYGAGFIEYYAEESKRVMGATIPTISNDRRLQTYKQPVGVVGCITPWNFPNAMIARKAGPALGSGCTIVIKPATETPLSALSMCELADRAVRVGLPTDDRRIFCHIAIDAKERFHEDVDIRFIGLDPVEVAEQRLVAGVYFEHRQDVETVAFLLDQRRCRRRLTGDRQILLGQGVDDHLLADDKTQQHGGYIHFLLPVRQDG